MRRVRHRIRKHERACHVRQIGNRAHRIHRADGVRRQPDGDDSRFIRQLFFKIAHVERAIVRVNVHAFYHYAAFFQCNPGGDIGIMVEARDDDFIARVQPTSERARNRKRERCHVWTKHDFFGTRGVEKIGKGEARVMDHFITALARRKDAAVIRVRSQEIFRDRVNHRLCDLGAAGIVEKDCFRRDDRRKVRTNPLGIERHGKLLESDACIVTATIEMR